MAVVPDDRELNRLAAQVNERLASESLMLATAESCTGGWVAKLITDITGSSAVLDRGFVTYSNASKQAMLDVPLQILDTFGAVSEQTAGAMAEGALKNSQADISLAITGIAGPGGGSAEKPVGTVFLAWARKGEALRVERAQFPGDRDAVRRQAAARAMAGVIAGLNAL